MLDIKFVRENVELVKEVPVEVEVKSQSVAI